MCYKQERELQDSLKIEEKIRCYPDFLQDYFIRIPSNSTKKSNFSTINYLLKWLIKQNIIDKCDIKSISKEDLDTIKETHIIKYLDDLENGKYGKRIAINTIMTKKNILSSLWSFLSDHDYVRKNVIRLIPKQTYKLDEERNVKIPTIEQFII